MSYPRNEDSVRPYRLWHAQEKRQLQWRYFTDPKRAHMGALIEARWSAVGTTIEVFNTHTGRLLGQYTRRLTTIHFMGGQ